MSDQYLDIERDTQERIIALNRLGGMSSTQIGKLINLPPNIVGKIMKSDTYRATLKTIADEMVTEAASTWRAKMNDLVPEAFRVIKESLKNNKLDAVKLVLTSIGIDKQEVSQQAPSLTVVLPSEPKTIKDV